jgi:hypothetical protein
VLVRRCEPNRATACSSSISRPAKVPGAKTVGDMRQFYTNQVPMKKGCTYDDICNALIFLAGDAAGYLIPFPNDDRDIGRARHSVRAVVVS